MALAGGLRERGWETAAGLPERGELAERLERADVEVIVQPLAVLRRRLMNPRGLASLAMEARRERSGLAQLARGAALVHSNTSVILGGGAAASAAGIPHVVHVREIYAGATGGIAARAWPLMRRRLMRADARVCVSRAVAAQFDADGTHVIHDGVATGPDAGGAPDAGAAHGPFTVAVLGRIADWKGQDVLARALADPALAEIGAVGLIAGDAYPGESAPDIRALAGELGLGDRLQLLGFRRDPAEVLARADVVAVPSTRPDPLPNSALEALAAGLPVVAAAHGGLPEIVQDDVTGLLVPPGDPATLARALRRLADDPALRARMGEAARKDARTRFSRERMLDEVEALYRRLTA